MDRSRPHHSVRNRSSVANNETSPDEDTRNAHEDTIFLRVGYTLRPRRYNQISYEEGESDYSEDYSSDEDDHEENAYLYDYESSVDDSEVDGHDYGQSDDSADFDEAYNEERDHDYEDLDDLVYEDVDDLHDYENRVADSEVDGHFHEENVYPHVEIVIAHEENLRGNEGNVTVEGEAREEVNASSEDLVVVQNDSNSIIRESNCDVAHGVKRKASEPAAEDPPSKRANPELPLCPVCRSLLQGRQIVAAKCGHVTCHACMQVILRGTYQKKCPICRARIRRRSVFNIYL